MQKKLTPNGANPILDFIFSKIEVVDMEVLKYLIGLLVPEVQERFVYALAGIYNPAMMIAALSKKSRPLQNISDKEYSDATLLSYDYLEDLVRFKVSRVSYAIFKTEEDATYFSQRGRFKNWGSGEYQKTPTEEYPCLGIYSSEDELSCSYSEWISNAIIEEGE